MQSRLPCFGATPAAAVAAALVLVAAAAAASSAVKPLCETSSAAGPEGGCLLRAASADGRSGGDSEDDEASLYQLVKPSAIGQRSPKPEVELQLDVQPDGPRPNPPEWGPNVHVFTPETKGIQGVVDKAFKLNGGAKEHGQFSDERFAFLFAPGTYDVEVPVGYYTSVAGLGVKPGDTVFASERGVYSTEADSDFTVGALDTFWRSAENFRTKATWQAWPGAPPGMLWATSQSTPLRRISVDENLVIFQYEKGDAAGYASGGFLADSKIKGSVEAGGQQQYFNRNSAMKEWNGGVWNIISVGSDGAPEDTCQPSKSVVSLPKTQLIAEKPYITLQGGRFQLHVPMPRKSAHGPSWLAEGAPPDRVVDFSRVYVARAGEDSAESLNAALRDAAIEAMVFTPGIYKLDAPIKVARPGLVLLGLGFATLVATRGNILIEVDGSQGGIRVAALLLQAGPELSPALLRWGPGSPSEPGFLHDIFARVGGPDQEEVQADTMVLIEGDNVVGDDFWLWRADHSVKGLTSPALNPAKHGLVVHGADVHMYGLAVEHTLEDLTLWTGERGSTYFYQAELPYGVDQESFGDSGFVGYRVADGVKEHHAVGLGVYSYFRDHPVTVQSGISVPPNLLDSIVQPLTVRLDGSGSVRHVLDGIGAQIDNKHQVAVLCPDQVRSWEKEHPPTASPSPATVAAPQAPPSPEADAPPVAPGEVSPHGGASKARCPTPAPPAPLSPREFQAGPQQNPPDWGPHVHVFAPDSNDIECAVEAAYAQNGGDNDHGQFSSDRFAFLFKPGNYTADVPVGYYTSVAGLGARPEEVVFSGEKGVYCREGASDFTVGALDTFWRSAENFRTQATWQAWNGAPPGMLWASSQATPLRRVAVDKNLVIFQYERGDAAGFASGGFLADCKVGGNVEAGGQQQYFSRNNAMEAWTGGVWNIVSVGSQGAPEDDCQPGKSRVSVASTPRMAEKPFIAVDPDDHERFQLRVPAVRKQSQGPSWLEGNGPADQVIDFESVYVARAGEDSAKSINDALADEGIQAVVFTPGIYHLDAPLLVGRPGLVLLGMGLATLVATSGNVLIEVDGSLDGVRVAALLLQAGPESSSSLLHWGPGSPSEPGFLHDIFARVGGPDAGVVRADTMVLIEGDGVVGDDFWLWRADHRIGGLTHPSTNPAMHGLVVHGAGVQMYGLAVEHTLSDLTLWTGEDGATYFYQSELPYGVSQENFGDGGYAGYRVADNVKQHYAVGVGVYSFFRDSPVTVESGIRAPAGLVKSFVQPLTVFLDGKGTIRHVINDLGDAINTSSQVSVLCP